MPPIRDPDRTDFKIRDMVLIKNHTPKDAFDSTYKPSFRICKKISDKAFEVVLQRSDKCQYNTYKYYTMQNTCWPIYLT